MAARVLNRTLGIGVLVVALITLAAVAIGLFLLRQPHLDPVPIPSVSRV